MSDPTRAEAAAYKSAATQTICGLQSALEQRLQRIAAAFWGLSTKTTTAEPTVVGAFLPPKTGSDDERFPHLIARPSNGADPAESDSEAGSRATFEIVIGTFSDTDDGWRDVLAIIDAIRFDLGADPVLGGAFVHTGPLLWELPEVQLRPQWQGVVTVTFTLPRPVRVEARNPAQE